MPLQSSKTPVELRTNAKKIRTRDPKVPSPGNIIPGLRHENIEVFRNMDVVVTPPENKDPTEIPIPTHSDPDSTLFDPVPEEKKFRCNARHFALTYAQCTIDFDEMKTWLETFWAPHCLTIGQEHHADGGKHFHIYLGFVKKKNIKNSRYWDFKGFHPNWGAVKSIEGWKKYCKKEGFRIYEKTNRLTPLDVELGSKKRMIEDQEYERQWLEGQDREEITYPITLFGHTINKPDPAYKRRHLWIVGPPDAGKTKELNDIFDKKKVFQRGPHNYPFEDYEDEDIILYDDYIPRFDEIADVSNTYKIRKRVYDNVRWNRKYWKYNSTRTMVVLTNKPISKIFGKSENLGAVKARFIEIDLRAASPSGSASLNSNSAHVPGLPPGNPHRSNRQVVVANAPPPSLRSPRVDATLGLADAQHWRENNPPETHFETWRNMSEDEKESLYEMIY